MASHRLARYRARTTKGLVLFVSLNCAILFAVEAPPPVYSPEEQLKSFQFAEPGYRIELVASEPMVEDPVFIRFDGEGRLWVVEMRAYMQDIDRSRVNEPIGRICVLEDTDSDGAMDKRTVFMDGLVLPRSIAIHSDGVLVAESKPLWFVEDTDGDLVADRKTLVDPNYARDNIEHSANGLYRAMDNWIYNAKEGHRYKREGDAWIRDETEARGQWGICQDDYGRLVYNYNHSQLHADLIPANAFTRNPNHNPTTGLSVGVTSSNAVFPIRPTIAANRGYIPGALDDQGRIREFTSACAPWIYRGALLPEFSGNAFVCEPVGNLIKRNLISNTNETIIGNPAYGARDFLASTDERFRPCWLETGPSGALYVADMYRGIVQDGIHMSPYLRDISIQREMDTPIHLGRIWRIVPDDFSEPAPPRFANQSVDELVTHLSHPSGWWRDQAQMRLVERGDRSVFPALLNTSLHHADTVARLHALWTLEGLHFPEPETLVGALSDDSPFVATAALRVLLNLGLDHDRIATEIDAIARRKLTAQTRLQAILTLGDLEIDDAQRFVLLEKLVTPQLDNPLFRDAAMSSLANREIAFLQTLWPELPQSAAPNAGISFFVETLSQAIAKSRNPTALASLLELINTPQSNWKDLAAKTGLELHAAALTSAPVSLASEPKVANRYPELRAYFRWPGHEPAAPNIPETRALDPKEQVLFSKGRQVYLSSCVACHGPDGQGAKQIAPPLANSDWVLGSEERLVRVLFHGLQGPITVSGKRYAAPDIQPFMPPFAALSNTDIAAVLTYIRREWGNHANPISPGEVSQHRIQAQGRTVPWTQAELEPFSK